MGGQKGRLALQDIGHGGSLTTNQWEEAQTMIIQTFKSMTATGAEDNKKSGGQKGRLALQHIGHCGSLTTNQWEEAQTMIIQTKTGFEQLITLTKKCLASINFDQTDSLYGLAILGCAERNPHWQGIHGQIQNSISNSTGMYMCVQCHAWLFLAKVVSWVQ